MTLNALVCSIGVTDITLDGSLGGPSGALSGPNFVIRADMGKQVDTNLFHSFGQFNIFNGESATFTGDGATGAINNVLSRVTGGSSSTIDGLLRSTISGADLFLINPAGIMFGANAQLNVEGSFHASTADFIRLGKAGRFGVAQPQNSILTAAAPSAFGFLGENPAGISIQGSNLEVSTGETLSVVGGDIEIFGGKLSAPSGRINIASVASQGEVVPNFQEPAGGLDTDSFDKLGTITASLGTTLNVTGQGGGGIFIRSGSFTLEDDSQINSSTEDSSVGQGATISVVADTVELNKSAQISSTTGLLSVGQGGSISVEAGEMLMDGNAQINSTKRGSLGEVQGGDISVNANKLTLRDGAQIQSQTFFGEGQGGDISVNANKLTLREGAQIISRPFGGSQGGKITITATDSLFVTSSNNELLTGIFSNAIGSDTNSGMISITASDLKIAEGGTIAGLASAGGNNSDISIKAKSLTLENDARITNSTISPNLGGNISIDITGSLTMDGGSISSNTLIDAIEDTKGGDIKISAKDIVISGNQSNPGSISSFTSGKGKGGNITVTGTESISMSGSGFISAESISRLIGNPSDVGDAGNISISSPTLIMDGDVFIRVSTTTDGDAGNIQVDVASLKLTNGANIDSSSGESDLSGFITVGKGQAGAVTVFATDSIFISGSSRTVFANPSGIFSQDAGVINQPGERSSGNVHVTTPVLMMDNKGEIRADTSGDRGAGEIIVNVEDLKLTNGARISSDSGVEVENGVFIGNGQGGVVNITASNSLSISGKDSAVSTNTLGTGKGGNIQVKAKQIALNDGATISASSLGEALSNVLNENPEAGKAGDIIIQVDDIIQLQKGSSVTVETAQANGGSIEFKVGRLVHLRDQSSITTSVAGGTGDGGNITIDPVFVVLDGASEIRADAQRGSGGNINIQITGGGAFFLSPDSVVSASSEFGIDGSIIVNAPDTDIRGIISTLPASFFDASLLLSERCSARTAEGIGSFVVRGSGGVPLNPNASLLSSYAINSFSSTAKRRVRTGHKHEAGRMKLRSERVFAMLRFECGM